MDLLFLSHRFFPDNDIRMSYGPYPMIYKLAKELAKSINVKVIAGGKGREKIDGIEVIRIPMFGSEIARSYCFSYSLFGLNSVLKEKADVMHAQGIDGSLLFGVIKNKIPKISTIHAFYKGHEIARPYNYGVFDFSGKFDKLTADIVNNLWDKLMIKNSDILFVLSKFSKKETVDLTKTKKRICIVYNGTDTELFKPFNVDKKFLGFNETDPVILFLGGLSWRKGADVMLKSFVEAKKEYENLKLVIVGAKELKRYSEIVPTELVDDIKFVGSIKNSELPKFYNACDVFVHPSFHETLAAAPLEAMACEKPVVAFNTTAMPEAITEKEGVLADVGDVKGITKGIVNFLDNPKKARIAGKNGRRRVQKYFTIEKVAELHIKYYRDIA